MKKQDKYCQNCGTKLQEGECQNCIVSNKKNNNTPALLGFILSISGILVIPGLILSIIGLISKKDYKNNRKELAIAGIVISSVLIFLFIISICFGSYNFDEENVNINKNETTKNVEVKMIEVPDFSTMSKEDTEKWCNEKSIECNITEDYSDSVESGKLISQSVEKNIEIEEDSKVDIIYSKGHKKTSEEIENEFKAQCTELDYRDALRNPSGHSGQKVHLFGKVSQVISKTTYMIYINCSENQYASGGYVCDDPVYVKYYGTLNLIEDDIVEIWGTMDSTSYTYTTVLGASKTVPQLSSFYASIK